MYPYLTLKQELQSSAEALEHNKEIDEDALLYVAEHIRSSVRELEGALLKNHINVGI